MVSSQKAGARERGKPVRRILDTECARPGRWLDCLTGAALACLGLGGCSIYWVKANPGARQARWGQRLFIVTLLALLTNVTAVQRILYTRRIARDTALR